MKVTVKFSKTLSNLIDLDSITIDASTYRDIIDACLVLIPSIKKIVKERTILSVVSKDKIISSNELDFKLKYSEVIVVPTVAGGLVTSFDSLGNLNVFYGANKAFSGEEMSLSGLNRRIVDSSLFGQAQTAFDLVQRKTLRQDGTLEGNEDPTTGFGSLNITSVYGQPIPLNFGMVRVGGAVINSYIKHIQRGGIDSVKVSDYVK